MFYYINGTKLTSLSSRPIHNVTSKDRGIGEGDNVQNSNEVKIIRGVNKFRGVGKTI